MSISCYQLFRLWVLPSLRALFTCIQHMFPRLPASSTITYSRPWSLLRGESELDPPIDAKNPHNHDHSLNVKTSGFIGRPLPHLPRLSNAFKATFAFINGLPAFGPGEDNLEEPISRRPSVIGVELSARVRTWATSFLTLLKDGTPTLQCAPCAAAWLVHSYLRPTPPWPKNRIFVLTSIAYHLGGIYQWRKPCLQVALAFTCTVIWYFGLKGNRPFIPSIAGLVLISQWLRTAPVLAYADAGADRRNFKLEADQSFIANSMASDQAEEMPNPPSPGSTTLSQSPTPVPQIPNNAPNILEPASPSRFMPSDPIPTIDSDATHPYELYFWPTSPDFHGQIRRPQGRATRGGVYSDVFCCDIQFRTPSEGLPTKVGMKVLRSVSLDDSNRALQQERMLQRFQQEGITWFGLLKHPNIVPLIGWTLAPYLSFVSPWYEQGNLHKHLRALSGIKRMQLLLGIAKGLECLHSQAPPVVHGDLKPENILLSDEGQPLLADFGLSTILGAEGLYSPSHRVGGSLAWMAPECMTEGGRSCQSDVYSFGNVAFAVLTGELPYDGLADTQIVIKVCNDARPGGPIEDWNKYPRLHGSIGDLLRACWLRSPESRPSMPTIVERLTTLLALSESETDTQPSSSTM